MSTQKCSVSGCNRPVHIGKDMCLEHYKEKGAYTYGMDAEIQSKIQAKFNVENAAQAQAWLEALTKTVFPGDFQESLKSGVILCQALNAIKPGTVQSINSSNMPFKQRENIENYLRGCKSLGMKEVDVFVTQDLFEGANLAVVVDNIFALGAVARNVSGFRGPFIGVKHADKNVRNFTDEQLNKGKSVMSRQTVGSYGYQDESKNPELSRQIIKNVSGHKAAEVPSMLNQGSYGVQPESDPLAQDKIIKNASELSAQRGSVMRGSAAPAAAAAPAGGKFCSKCGAARAGDAKFCGSCGNRF